MMRDEPEYMPGKIGMGLGTYGNICAACPKERFCRDRVMGRVKKADWLMCEIPDENDYRRRRERSNNGRHPHSPEQNAV